MKIVLILLFAFTLFGEEIDPITKVNEWYKEEKGRTEGPFIKWATLATATLHGYPHTHLVEIVHLSKEQGFLFFIHKESQEAHDLSLNQQATLHLLLPRTHRSVSVEGIVHPISSTEIEKNWKKLPLYKKQFFLPEKTPPKDSPPPPNFGGYRIVPHLVSFSEKPLRTPPSEEVMTYEPKSMN